MRTWQQIGMYSYAGDSCRCPHRAGGWHVRHLIVGRRATTLPVRFLLVFILLIWIAPVAKLRAQSPSPLTADVDRTAIASDEVVTLTVTVNGSDAPRPNLTGLVGFRIVGSSSASQISIVNGVMSSQTTYRYILEPEQPGELTIPAITMTIDGRSHSTIPIPIQVTQGTGAAPSSPGQPAPIAPQTLANGRDFFVEALVDNETSYLGQQLAYIFRFYQAGNLLGQPTYTAPGFTGFWQHPETQQVQYRTTVGDRDYRVTELQTILFPTVLGELTIDPALLALPGTFLRSGDSLESESVVLNVRPLPLPAPDTFNGAVGQIEGLEATLDTSETSVNEPVTLRLTLTGWGHVDAWPDPVVPEQTAWRAFEATTTANTQLENGRQRGNQVYEQLLVPTTEGNFTIPAIPYTYFDPETESYQTVTSEPLTVVVTGGAAEAPPPAIPGLNRETVAQLEQDIRHIKPVPPVLATTQARVTNSALYWFFWLLPLLALALDWRWQQRWRFQQDNQHLVRRLQAQKRASQLLAQARRQQSDPYETSERVLRSYLDDKLTQPITGLTQPALMQLLRDNGLEEPLVERVNSLLQQSEIGRYAPGAMRNGQAPDLFRETEQLIIDLEGAL